MCKTCETDKRNLWTYENYPKLDRVQNANWISLVKCPECTQLWLESPHEPYASFTFLTKWEFDEKEFSRLAEVDDSASLHKIHDKMIVDYWETLPSNEQDAVNRWRNRTYRSLNPIDKAIIEERATIKVKKL